MGIRDIYNSMKGSLPGGMRADSNAQAFANECIAKGMNDSEIKKAGKAKGFTLIELLVVIGIIGILAGFLAPPLVEARKKSKMAACINNLSQIGKAIVQYTMDYEGMFPSADMLNSSNVLWSSDTYANYGKLYEKGYVGDGKIFYCPSANFFKINNPDYGIQNLGQSGKTAYSNYYQRALPQGAPINVESLGNETKALLGDYETKNPVQTGNKTAWNHKDGVNVLFSDGHVKWVLGDWDVRNATQGDIFWPEMDTK